LNKLLAAALVLLFPGLLPGPTAGGTRPAITGLSHVTFYADDISKSEAFYEGLLGWDRVPAAGAGSGVRFYANHLQYIELLSPPKPGMIDRMDSIGFLTSDAEALRRYLSAHGVVVPSAITVETDGSRSFLTRDPEGNRIEFTQPGNHSPRAPESVSQRLSTHIIHAGLVAHDRTVLDHFYKDLLGFRLYWQGGAKAGQTDWVMMQVPDGTDWLEYMLYLPAAPSRGQLAGAYHFAPGVVSVTELQKRLIARGWTPAAQERPPLLAFDGKWQLDLFDPDGTRVEFMEFHPVREPCCAPFTAPQPDPSPAW
jgi:catechol 2,3-dioxygenase-like lactoylglutathione lyase family enzyme